MPLSVQQLEKRETSCKPPVLMDVVSEQALSLNIELVNTDTHGAGLRVHAYNASK